MEEYTREYITLRRMRDLLQNKPIIIEDKEYTNKEIKRMVSGDVTLEIININGKWYWGLPEDEGDQINNNLEENKNE